MSKYIHLFLDFDDTIYDTHGNANIALREAYDFFKLDKIFGTFEMYSSLYWKRNQEVWALYSLGKITKDELIVERFLYPLRQLNTGTPEFALQMNDWFLERTAEKSGLVDGALDLLNYLKPKYKLHILSNGFTEVQYKKIRNAGLEEFFDNVFLSEMIGINKPDRRIYDYALDKSGASRKNVIMIGDNYDTDITGAINSGIDQIFFNRNETFLPDIPPTYEVKDLNQITLIL